MALLQVAGQVLSFIPCCRFRAKLPGRVTGGVISIGDALISWVRLRDEAQNVLHERILKRMIHTFAQVVEQSLANKCSSEIPEPRPGFDHPFTKKNRAAGSQCLLQATLAGKFLARGGGFVSLKDEKTLLQLKLVDRKSNIGHVTASHFVAKHLMKHSEAMETFKRSCELPVLNFCFDAARIFKMEEWLSLKRLVVQFRNFIGL